MEEQETSGEWAGGLNIVNLSLFFRCAHKGLNQQKKLFFFSVIVSFKKTKKSELILLFLLLEKP
jgi:hypothetical protein